MITISIAEMRQRLADVLNQALFGKERIVLTRHSQPVGAIVPMEDYHLLEALEDKLDLQEALAVLNDPESEFVDWGTTATKP